MDAKPTAAAPDAPAAPPAAPVVPLTDILVQRLLQLRPELRNTSDLERLLRAFEVEAGRLTAGAKG